MQRRLLRRRVFGLAIVCIFGIALGNRHGVICAEAIECGRDGDAATRDFDGTFAFLQIRSIVGIALDAIAFCRGDIDGTAANRHRAFALEAVVFRIDRDESVFDSQVVARVNTVIVICFDDKRTFALDGEVVFRVNASAGRIGLGLTRVVCIRVRFRSRGCVRNKKLNPKKLSHKLKMLPLNLKSLQAFLKTCP